MEIWKDIPGYEGLYKASNLGNVKSLWFQSNLQNKKYYREKILKPKKSKNNCLRVDLWKNGEHKTWTIHRLIGITFLKNDKYKKLTINHKDGNRLNNNVENLEWVTLAENIKHGFDKGLYSNQTKTKVINKHTKEEYIFTSMSKASKYIGYGEKYISDKVRKNILENELYKWVV